MHIRETLENTGKKNQNKTTLLFAASDIIMVNTLVCILSTF